MAYKGDTDEERGGIKWSDAVVPIVLILLFVLALAIRGAFYWGPAAATTKTYGDQAYLLSGNDPDYHKITVDYEQQTHKQSIWDPMLDFPRGGANPNPPLYSWSISLMGYMLAPFYHGDVTTSTWVMMEWAAAFWAALTIFPVYIFTRDMFGKKAGIWAAFFIAVMAGNVERTPVGFSDHDAFYVFFIVLSFLFLMRALRMLNTRTYVKNYFNAKSLATGTYELLAENKKAFLYATLAALSISGVFLAWKGVVYIYAILLVYFIFHLAIKKFRKEEGLGIALIMLVTVGLSLVMTFPYYRIDYYTGWFESPLFVFVAMCVLALLLVPTRDLPWIVVVPTIAILVFGGAFAMTKMFPDIMRTIFDLQGYFVKTKLYETIAEAQAPDYSRMVFSYGVMTFYMALIGAGFAMYRLPKEKWRNDYIITVIWAAVSIYMAMSATRFMYNATPVFAIMGAWATDALIKMTGYGEMMRTYSGLKSERLYAIRKSVKPRHILTALFVIGLIIFPNFWYGLDAGIPYETKQKYDKQIYDALPSALRPSATQYSSASSQWWLGSFGTDYPSDYWVDGLYWLAEQDNSTIPSERPGFISWWDYGHWALHMGQHPSAADNFQNGFQWAGNFISAQNESVAIALTVAKILDGDMYKDKHVLDILERYVGKDERDNFYNYSTHPADYKEHILKNPQIYGPHDTKRMDPVNMKWLMMSRMLTTKLDMEKLVELTHDLEVYTGQSLRYFAMDTRLLPVGPKNTGIYYAPIKLADENINDFLMVFAVGNDGSRIDVNNRTALTAASQQEGYSVDHYEIEYSNMFYNSMFYRCYVGWKPLDADINEPGIPIITRAADVGMQQLQIASMPPLQGWNMTHYRLAYRTQYWNPNATEPSQHPADWKIISPSKAAQYENQSKSTDPAIKDAAGIVDTTYRGLFGGVFFLKYYDGAFINGTVTLPDGTPLPGVRVTVYDDVELLSTEWPGVPHGYTFTDKDGHYSIVAPYGNVTVRLSNGGQDQSGNARINQLLMQSERRILNTSNIMITDNQAMRVDEDLDGDGNWDFNIRHDVVVNYSNLSGRAYWDENNNAQFDTGVDQPLTGMVALTGSSYNRNQTTPIASNGTFDFPQVVPDYYNLSYVPAEGQSYQYITAISFSPSSPMTQDIALAPAALAGNVTDFNGTPLTGVHMVLFDRINNSVSYGITSGVNGTYNVSRVLEGNYTLRVNDERYSGIDTNLDIAAGTDNFMDMTVSLNIGLSGTACLPDGSPASGATIVARNVLDDQLSVNMLVGPDGKYHGHMASGNYSVNGKVIRDSDTYSFMQNVDISKDSIVNATFKLSYRLNGTVFADLNDNGIYDPPKATTTGGSGSIPNAVVTEYRTDIHVEFDGPAGNISLVSNGKGGYEAYLVPGDYVVYMYSDTASGSNITGLAALKVVGNMLANLKVVDGTDFKGTVFYDRDLNGMVDQGEALDRAQVTFDDGPTALLKHSGKDGIMDLLLPDGNYTVGVQFAGYKSFGQAMDIKGGTLYKNIVLNPSNITLTGTAGIDADGNGKIDSGEGVDVIIKFVPKEKEGTAATVSIESGPGGLFSTSLFPVNYTVQVDEKVTTASGEVRYLYNKDLSLHIGQVSTNTDLILDKYYKVSGNIYYDINGNDILNLGERRSPALRFYDSTDSTISATVTADGYVVYLKAGTYSYYAYMGEPASPSMEGVVLSKVTIGAETKLDLKMVPATRLNGVLYFDANGNKKLDMGEQERDVTIKFSIMSDEAVAGSMTSVSNDIGEYTVYVPWDANYTISIDDTQSKTFSMRPYTVKYGLTEKVKAPIDEKTLVHDLSADKSYRVWGNVTYISPTGAVKLGGAVLKFGTFTTTSKANGSYALFVRPGKYEATVDLAGFTLPKSSFGNRSVSYDTTEQNFILDPKNVTLEGHVFVDLNGDGTMGSKNEGVQAQVLEFIAADFRAVNGSTTTDPRGKFSVNLKPGSYYIWVQAASGIHHYVAFERYGLNASGQVAVHDFQVREGLALEGSIYLLNTDQHRVIPVGVNITLEQNRTGIKRTMPVTTADYAYYLPGGVYNLTAHYKDKEYGQTMNYDLNTKVNLTDRTQMDLVFLKEKNYFLQVTWDAKEKVTLAQNTSTTYHVTVKNVGNEPGTWELFGSPPSGWKAAPSKDKASLAIGESTSFSVLINVSANARAGDNPITVGGRMSGLEVQNTTTAYVSVIQVFNISLAASETAPLIGSGSTYTYYVTLKNDGNGMDNVRLYLVSTFPDWNITIKDRTPPMGAGQTKEVVVLFTPLDPQNMTGIAMKPTFRAVSQSGILSEYTMSVSFPDLVGDLEITGPGVKVQKEGGAKAFIPGFEPLLVMGALVVACAAIYVRRKGGERA